GARVLHRKCDEISADISPLRLVATAVLEIVSTCAAASAIVRGVVPGCPPGQVFAVANRDRMPSRALAMEPIRAPSANAAALASQVAGVEAVDPIAAGDMKARLCPERLLLSLVAIGLIAIMPAACASIQGQQRFASPEEGMSALVEAIRGNDQSALMTLLGGSGE